MTVKNLKRYPVGVLGLKNETLNLGPKESAAVDGTLFEDAPDLLSKVAQGIVAVEMEGPIEFVSKKQSSKKASSEVAEIQKVIPSEPKLKIDLGKVPDKTSKEPRKEVK